MSVRSRGEHILPIRKCSWTCVLQCGLPIVCIRRRIRVARLWERLTVVYMLDESRQMVEHLPAILPLTCHGIRLLVLPKHTCFCRKWRARPRGGCAILAALAKRGDVLIARRVREVGGRPQTWRGRWAVYAASHGRSENNHLGRLLECFLAQREAKGALNVVDALGDERFKQDAGTSLL